MKEYIKCYHVFLSQRWMKWLVYLIYPIFMIAVIYGMNHIITWFGFICAIFTGAMVVGAEIMLDMLMFKRIATKDTNQLEYLKTSLKGLPVLKKSLIADAVRRFLSMLVIFIGAYAVIEQDYKLGYAFTLINALRYAICIFALTEIGLLITRSVSAYIVDFAIIYLFSALAGGIFLILVNDWLTAIFAIVGILIAVFGRKWIMKKARESYYDERVKNGI